MVVLSFQTLILLSQRVVSQSFFFFYSLISRHSHKANWKPQALFFFVSEEWGLAKYLCYYSKTLV